MFVSWPRRLTEAGAFAKGCHAFRVPSTQRDPAIVEPASGLIEHLGQGTGQGADLRGLEPFDLVKADPGVRPTVRHTQGNPPRQGGAVLRDERSAFLPTGFQEDIVRRV